MGNGYKDILIAGMELGEAKKAEGDYAAFPDGCRLEDLERFSDQPRRKRGLVKLGTSESFTHYVNDHKGSETAIFADAQRYAFHAVIDYHERGVESAPGWREHNAHFAMIQTDEWATWTNHDRQQMDQTAFGEFLEQNQIDVIRPLGAKLLELALDLEDKRSATFRSAVRMSDGMRQFRFEEEGQSPSELRIPEIFTLVIAPFEGTSKQNVQTRLRYRIKSSNLVLYYELIRPQDIRRAAFEAAREDIEEATEIKAYSGNIGKV